LGLTARDRRAAEKHMSKTTSLRTRVKKRGPQPRRKLTRIASGLGKKEGKIQVASAASQASPPVLDIPSRDGLCCHFWVIDLVQGPTSHGVCKRCDEERLFSNYLRPSGTLPEKDVSSLSDVPVQAGSDIDSVLRKQTGGYATAVAGLPRYTRKAWTYPRKGRGTMPR
jgi:hypothetical protein